MSLSLLVWIIQEVFKFDEWTLRQFFGDDDNGNDNDDGGLDTLLGDLFAHAVECTKVKGGGVTLDVNCCVDLAFGGTNCYNFIENRLILDDDDDDDDVDSRFAQFTHNRHEFYSALLVNPLFNLVDEVASHLSNRNCTPLYAQKTQLLKSLIGLTDLADYDNSKSNLGLIDAIMHSIHMIYESGWNHKFDSHNSNKWLIARGERASLDEDEKYMQAKTKLTHLILSAQP